MKQYQFVKDTDENGKESVNVSYKPKRRLDLFARFACLIAALVIWLAIVNFNQTDVTETMVLKIEYVGLENLENDGMMIYGMDKTEVTVTVRGSNRDIKKYDASDYSVVVDVSEIDEVGSYTLPIVVKIPTDSGATVEADSSFNVSLICDIAATREIPFDVLVSKVQEGGLITYSYEYEQSAEKISISGPQKILDMIYSARFKANGNFVSNADEMAYSDFPLVFLDKNLNEVNENGLVEYTTEDITVNVTAIAHKTISVNVNLHGGMDYTKKVTPDSIEIMGIPSKVRDMKPYTIDVTNPEVGKIVEHVITSEDLPDGVYVKDDEVTVVITFEKASKGNE